MMGGTFFLNRYYEKDIGSIRISEDNEYLLISRHVRDDMERPSPDI
jgi:hypothetical protein